MNPVSNEPIITREMVLDVLHKQFHVTATEKWLETVGVSHAREFLLAEMVYRLRLEIFGKITPHPSMKKTVSWSVPSSWWQHWKMSNAPKWFLKRWPVVYTHHSKTHTVTPSQTDLFPYATEDIPKRFGDRVSIFTTNWELEDTDVPA